MPVHDFPNMRGQSQTSMASQNTPRIVQQIGGRAKGLAALEMCKATGRGPCVRILVGRLQDVRERLHLFALMLVEMILNQPLSGLSKDYAASLLHLFAPYTLGL